MFGVLYMFLLWSITSVYTQDNGCVSLEQNDLMDQEQQQRRQEQQQRWQQQQQHKADEMTDNITINIINL